MSNSANHDMLYYVRSLISVRLMPKIGCLSMIVKRRTRWNLFDVLKIMFKSIQCSIKWHSTHHY